MQLLKNFVTYMLTVVLCSNFCDCGSQWSVVKAMERGEDDGKTCKGVQSWKWIRVVWCRRGQHLFIWYSDELMLMGDVRNWVIFFVSKSFFLYKFIFIVGMWLCTRRGKWGGFFFCFGFSKSILFFFYKIYFYFGAWDDLIKQIKGDYMF